MWGSVDAVKLLLSAKANPMHENRLRGSTPLHAAAVGRGPAELRAKCAELLVAYKGDPRKPDWSQLAPLDFVEDEVVRLAMGGVPMVLHNSVQSRRIQDLQDALQKVIAGAAGDLTVDSADGKGNTALHLAVKAKWGPAVELLLKARSNPSVCNLENRTPLHTAVISGDHYLVKLLLANKADVAAFDRDVDADPRFSSTTFEENPDEHRTALHYAAELCSVEVIKALLDSRANVNVKDSKGQSPLHLCMDLRSNPTIGMGCGVRLKELEKKPHWNGLIGTVLGAPAPCADDPTNIRCPVLIAGTAEDIPAEAVGLKLSSLELVPEEALDLLLHAKADVNDGNHVIGESKTLLHVAAKAGDVALARKLVAARADLDRMDSKLGLSALHLAARSKSTEVVRVLIEAKADQEKTASSGKTAADLAKVNGAPAELLALLSSDAQPEAVPAAARGYSSLTAEQRAALFID
eukprot:TRINITY_DN51279_c0_g1_i1.p1 TRINITY_DN51279_c0_g1~~TRINITY_DN51279_c0_g1_i1.p1  ORF type:complete len:527 (+),score=113.64 TRINITY_DN51279_c0_g1_i1:189-1583(+)